MSKYVDFAEYYDFDHNITVDIEFYLDLAKHCQSPILELACETGRLLLPLAKAGNQVYGVDISANMLAVCQNAVQQHNLEHQIQLAQADLANFDAPDKNFGLVVIALRSYMHLLTQTEQRAWLPKIRAPLCNQPLLTRF